MSRATYKLIDAIRGEGLGICSWGLYEGASSREIIGRVECPEPIFSADLDDGGVIQSYRI